jgi:hypothetical protein
MYNPGGNLTFAVCDDKGGRQENLETLLDGNP